MDRWQINWTLTTLVVCAIISTICLLILVLR